MKDAFLGGLRRLVADTELEDGSMLWRRLEEGDRGGHGLITGEIAIDKEYIQYWYLVGNQNGENLNGEKEATKEKNIREQEPEEKCYGVSDKWG
jgi:hypothetical protein